MKINNFQGDLTDISAKKEALVLLGSKHPIYIPVVWYVQQSTCAHVVIHGGS